MRWPASADSPVTKCTGQASTAPRAGDAEPRARASSHACCSASALRLLCFLLAHCFCPGRLLFKSPAAPSSLLQHQAGEPPTHSQSSSVAYQIASAGRVISQGPIRYLPRLHYYYLLYPPRSPLPLLQPALHCSALLCSALQGPPRRQPASLSATTTITTTTTTTTTTPRPCPTTHNSPTAPRRDRPSLPSSPHAQQPQATTALLSPALPRGPRQHRPRPSRPRRVRRTSPTLAP